LVRLSSTRFDLSLPYWSDFQTFLQQLGGESFPGCNQLNALLPNDLRSAAGQAIRFVPSNQLDDSAYESRIYSTGQVSTRPNSWHDLFNALVWMRFPNLKSAMNALHHRSAPQSGNGKRGMQRDALTLFDESGVIVFSSDTAALEALASRDWSTVFQTKKCTDQLHHIICGHALLEKFLSPYKSMTAKALLILVEPSQMKLSREELLTHLDQRLATLLLAEEILTKPADLTPLPLAGITGWWINQTQDESFYADQQVFRRPSAPLTPVSLIAL
jgi:hypothetical protein